jgi:hypothetical protein
MGWISIFLPSDDGDYDEEFIVPEDPDDLEE